MSEKNTKFKGIIIATSGVFCLILIVITTTFNRVTLDNRGKAASNLLLEAEDAILAGKTTVGADSLASGGKYLYLGQISTPTSSPMPSSTIQPTIRPTATPTNNPALYPAQILNLTNWYLQLPIGQPGDPIYIKQPKLNTYSINPWFTTTSDKTGVQFRASVTGVGTSIGLGARSELREMLNDGTTSVNWSSTSGTHTMFVDQAITAVPKLDKFVIATQIHDPQDDIIRVVLKGSVLYINVGGTNVYALDRSYTLGKRFTIKYVVGNGQTKMYYNGSTTPVYTLNKNYTKSYFKAGVYIHATCSTEGSANCNDTNYGEVIVYDLKVMHQ